QNLPGGVGGEGGHVRPLTQNAVNRNRLSGTRRDKRRLAAADVLALVRGIQPVLPAERHVERYFERVALAQAEIAAAAEIGLAGPLPRAIVGLSPGNVAAFRLDQPVRADANLSRLHGARGERFCLDG